MDSSQIIVLFVIDTYDDTNDIPSEYFVDEQKN